MLLGNLLRSVRKKYRKISVEGICFDSRKVKKKDIFFAIRGSKTSGTKFIKEAISKGVSAIVSNKKVKLKNSKIPLFIVNDVRKSLSEACSNFYKKKPSSIIAVTGTNGKSSVADFFYQILNLHKVSVASIGTLGIVSKKYNKKTSLTSIDPLSLHRNLQILARKKINYVILEASSHGLKQKRLDNLNIKAGIFTNLSHDHLDYHNSMQSYFGSKLYLFKSLLKKNSRIITDEDNKEFTTIKNIANRKKIKTITIGSSSGTIKILQHKYQQNKQIVKVYVNSKIISLHIPLIGYFQVKNLLMAILAASCCGININKAFKVINNIRPVSGRLECIANLKNNAKIILDFAHTPEALKQSLIALKDQFRRNIILVFGCGGERDKKKRSIMGTIAAKYCRKIFVTDDNPRNENPKKIRKAIIESCKELALEIGSRKKAIETAIKELNEGEILLVAGKGHEKTQDYGDKIINFSDKKIIRAIIKKRKILSTKSNWSQDLAKKAFNNKNLKNVNYNGVSINTKTIKENNLFFAIRGKNTDGHKFVKEAFKKGAIKSVVSKRMNRVSSNKLIKVKNTLSSLNQLANVTRENSFAQIIGITGSVGKTTLKNLISFALNSYGKAYHSPHSYNNKFGVPLSISNLKKDTEYGVFEIGMNKKGEIDKLSKIVKPEIAIITNISEAHFENFDNLQSIAKAKAEIINHISKDGNIILNKDSQFFKFLSKKANKNEINVVTFGLKKKSDVFLLGIKKIRNFYRLKVIVKNKIYYFDTKYIFNNIIKNILACICVLMILNLNLKKIRKKFINFKIPDGRGDVKLVRKFNKKFKFIDESYNANPLSMISAIKNMNNYKRKNNEKKLMLLGDMLELGKNSKSLHKKLSIEINRSDVDKVFVYGKYIQETFNSLVNNKKGKIFNNLKEANDYLGKIIHNNDLLMVKGSNATGLNQLSKNIKRRQINAI